MIKYWDNFKEIEINLRKDLDINKTTVIKTSFQNQSIWIKDENENTNGSFKDRGVYYQVVRHIQEGNNKFALSSSGNAAISSLYLQHHFDFELEIFISNKINTEKIEKISKFKNDKIQIHQSDKPRSELMSFLRNHPDFTNLRGSTDVYAPIGYKTISYELIEQVPEIDAIFIPCSSGTSTLGIQEGFMEKNIKVPIHICQTEKIHPVAKYYDKSYQDNNNSLADAITDRVAHRRPIINKIIEDSGGFGWVISDEDLVRNQMDIKKLIDKEYSYNSILAFSGWYKALKNGYNYRNPVLLFSGL